MAAEPWYAVEDVLPGPDAESVWVVAPPARLGVSFRLPRFDCNLRYYEGV